MGSRGTAGFVIESPSASLRHYTIPKASDSMGEIPLARLWQLLDGTSCLLLKDARTENWELRVVRHSDVLRSERFGSPIVAMDQAKHWRSAYDGSVQSSS